jgi:hypothetical protein
VAAKKQKPTPTRTRPVKETASPAPAEPTVDENITVPETATVDELPEIESLEELAALEEAVPELAQDSIKSIPRGGLAAAIAKAQTVKQELLKTPRQLAQNKPGVNKI